MPDVTLVLKANNSDQIAKMRQSQAETQKVYDVAEKGSARQKGLIEKEIQMQKQLGDSRNKATNIDNLKIYNGLLDDSKKRLNELEQAGLKAGGGGGDGGWTGKLGAAFLKLGLIIGAAFSVQKVWDFIKVTALAYDQQVQAEKKLLNALEGKERIQKRLIDQAKQIQKTTVFGDEEVVNAQAYLAAQGRTEEQIKKTIIVAVQLATVMGTDLMSATETLNMTYEGTIMRLGRLDGRLKGLTTEQLLNGAAIDLLGEKYKGFAEIAAIEGLGSLHVLNNAWGDFKETIGEVWSELLKVTGISDRATRQLQGTVSILSDKKIPLLQRWLSFFGIGTKKTLDQVNEDELTAKDMSEKTDKEKYDEKIAAYKKYLETLKALTSKEDANDALKLQNETFINNRNAFFDYIDALNKKKEDAWDFELEYGKNVFSSNQKAGKVAWDLMIKNEKDFKDADEKATKAKQENLAKAGAAVLDYIKIIDELAQREIEAAQRKRELLDTQIGETQSALQTEADLQKAGFASNVDAERVKLAALKVQRDKALKDEEIARKKEHTLKVAQLLAEQALSIAKVIMASEIAAAEARIMINNPITAIPGVALLTATRIGEAISIAAITASIIAASLSKFAKGGWTGDGRYRDETGERVAGVVHENEFVVKRGQAGRYRPLLDAINRDDKRMIFNSFNRLRPEFGGTTNVFVENEGPNNRLDQLITENKKLNAKLSGESIQNFGNVQVIRKGNSVRTIR